MKIWDNLWPCPQVVPRPLWWGGVNALAGGGGYLSVVGGGRGAVRVCVAVVEVVLGMFVCGLGYLSVGRWFWVCGWVCACRIRVEFRGGGGRWLVCWMDELTGGRH